MAQMYTFFLYEQKIGCFRGRLFIYRLTSTSQISMAKSREGKKIFIRRGEGGAGETTVAPTWGSVRGCRINRQLHPEGSASG